MNPHEEALSRLFAADGFPADAVGLQKLLGGRKLIVYGAGEAFHWISEILTRWYGYVPDIVLDRRFKTGATFEGIPAFPPSAYQPSEEEKREAVVILCIGKQEYHREILGTVRDLGFRNIISLMDIYEIHNPFRLPEALQRKGFNYYPEEKDRIFAALGLLADEESREIYVRLLQTHMQRKPVPLPSRPRGEQYFPRDVKLTRGYSRFVNCGAYDGDTIRSLNEVQGRVEEIVCFETEPRIFQRLVEYLARAKDQLAERVVAIPCAVYSGEGMVRFISGGGLGSRISEEGDSFVQSVALDHVLPGFKPSFICMDVEGAEAEVLKGAEGLIRANRPDLGVCVYHAPNHAWEIPLYLHGLGLGYRLYLRNYTSFTTETVLYATA
ncbi:MAG TPA: FkbM family methyltransferase [Thermodesulfobacteriota bacterium]|nr:FkbM family methyltransferase [Thermodesulfobacteriota bacterium]